MNRNIDEIILEAAHWHDASVRDEMDWDGFTLWLEADPAHRRAYEEIALTDALVEQHRDSLFDREEEPAAKFWPIATWKPWAGAALAASLLVAVLAPQFVQSDLRLYETQNATRSLTLADGSKVLLAPHSRLSIKEDGTRLALAGGAWFDIRHDPSRRLTITAGEVTIGDIGTQFDVQAEDRQIRVEVAEGSVQVVSASLSQPVKLTRGRALLFDGREGVAAVSKVAEDNVGEWRNGRLTYNAAPLSMVVADLERYAAVRILLPETLRNRTFSGTLIIGNGDTAIRDLSQVMDLELGRDDGGYRLSDRVG